MAFASDPFYAPVYALATQYDLPVIFHTGDVASATAKLQYAHPLTLDSVAVDYPQLTRVLAHAGYPWWRTAAEVAYKNPNVYLDTSAFVVGDVSTLSAADVETYLVAPLRWVFGYLDNPHKLLFGTDWPLVAMGPYIEAVSHAIPRPHWDAVFYANAVRVFNLRSTRDTADLGDVQEVCPHADRRATIVLHDCDSQVRNTRLPTGCTLADRVQEAWSRAGEEGLAALLAVLEAHGILSAAQAAATATCAGEDAML